MINQKCSKAQCTKAHKLMSEHTKNTLYHAMKEIFWDFCFFSIHIDIFKYHLWGSRALRGDSSDFVTCLISYWLACTAALRAHWPEEVTHDGAANRHFTAKFYRSKFDQLDWFDRLGLQCISSHPNWNGPEERANTNWTRSELLKMAADRANRRWQ